MSRFLATLLESAQRTSHGMTTGEPKAPVRREWREVHETACAMAGGLREVLGDEPRPSVGILAAAPAAIAPAAQAVWLNGGSVTMLHQPTGRTDLAGWASDTLGVLKTIEADLVLLGPPFEALAPVLQQHGIAFRTISSLEGPEPGGSALGGSAAPLVPDPGVAGEDDTALLQLTSGSTAAPKAVRITHGNLYANITAMAQAARLDADHDVMVSWLPLFHDMGMVGFLTVPMMCGLELVSVTPADFLARPLMWAELISRYRGTMTAAPNFAYSVLARQLARADGDLDLSSLRIALNGAEPIDPDAVDAFTAAGARFGLRPEAVLAAYGMAETALGVSFAPVEGGLEVDTIDAEQLEHHRRAVPATGPDGVRRFPKLGPPLPGIEVRVLDSAGDGDADGAGDGSGTGVVLGEREVGALQLRGESVTPGYLTADGPVATQDEQGWLDTGDDGYLADGQIVVCGRRKDVIIMGGRNIYPTDIERAASEADHVRAGNAVAVRRLAGAAGGRSRESFVVAVESRKAGDPEAEQLIRKDVTARVVSAVGVRPAEVVVLAPGTLPKTPSGKLRRAATAARLAPPVSAEPR